MRTQATQTSSEQRQQAAIQAAAAAAAALERASMTGHQVQQQQVQFFIDFIDY